MQKEDKREIKQLLIVAKNYLQLGKEKLAEINSDIVDKKISSYSDVEKLDEENIMFSAHVASAAIRLCTIDEKLDDKYRTSNIGNIPPLRKNLYNDIRFSRNGKSVRNIQPEYIKMILHFILRNNVAHIEEDKKNQNRPKSEHLILQRILLDHSTKEMYSIILNIIGMIEADLYLLDIVNA